MSAEARVLLFDAVGTLIVPDPPAAAVYCHVAREHGLPCDPATVRRNLRRLLRELDNGQPTSPQRERQFWSGVVRQALDVPPDLDLLPPLWDHFSQAGHWRLVAGVDELWRQLRRRGWSLGIASNFDARLKSVCRDLPPLSDCDHLFTCDALGYRKPHPEFYRLVSAALAVDPQQIVMVGDSFACDAAGPAAAGWRAIHLCSSPEPRPPQPNVGDRIRSVESLAQLGALLRL